uniref:Pyridoxamine 5'-phosphate oxidase family protein n=1 Tax=Roseihalotalea indica TaxID=2867963 RepID=A0AA49GN06_9BACT|nr:pyridoxamine 5'-phosphate oxidase family protein [Tunicatimonas sp. TK19036]
MGSSALQLSDEQIHWVQQQPLFFVATAPLQADGHINVSPKGLDCLRVINPKTVAYLDLTGSGNETSAHIAENGRITFMWCSFDKKPKIFRTYGQGEVVLPGTDRWAELISLFPDFPGSRQIVINHIEQTKTSCGFGVPLMELQEERSTLTDWANKQGEEGIQEYQKKKNTLSLDGLPTHLAKATAISQEKEH